MRGRSILFALLASCAHVQPTSPTVASPVPCALSVDGQPDEAAQCLVSIRAEISSPPVPAPAAGLLNVLGRVRVRTPAQLARRQCKLDFRLCVSEALQTFASPCPTLPCTRAGERIYAADVKRCDEKLAACVAPWPPVCAYMMRNGECAVDDSTWDLED